MGEASWRMPDVATEYDCWDGVRRRLGQLLECVDLDLWPADEREMAELLWAWGAEPAAA